MFWVTSVTRSGLLVLCIVAAFREKTLGQGRMLRLPFPPGNAWWVATGYNEEGTYHVGSSRYALDFNIEGAAWDDYGLPVLAVADGEVVISQCEV